VGNYFVLRVNALENNLILFDYVNSRRFTRASVSVKIETDLWWGFAWKPRGNQILGYLAGDLMTDTITEWPARGYVGLWAKVDSVTAFKNLTIKEKLEGGLR